MPINERYQWWELLDWFYSFYKWLTNNFWRLNIFHWIDQFWFFMCGYERFGFSYNFTYYYETFWHRGVFTTLGMRRGGGLGSWMFNCKWYNQNCTKIPRGPIIQKNNNYLRFRKSYENQNSVNHLSLYVLRNLLSGNLGGTSTFAQPTSTFWHSKNFFFIHFLKTNLFTAYTIAIKIN